MTGDGKSSRGTGRKSRSGKTYQTFQWQNGIEDVTLQNKPMLRSNQHPALLISSAPESPARMLASLDGEPDSPENGLDSSSSSPESCESYNPSGSSSRTFQACFLPIKDLISLSSSIRWTNAGMAYRGAFSIASTSESPRGAAECSLSDILVAHAHPKYSLSPKAAVGILRRAERRERTLPPQLRAALEAVASQSSLKPDLQLSEEISPTHLALALLSLVDTTPTEKHTLPPSPTEAVRTESKLRSCPTASAQALPTQEQAEGQTLSMSVRRLTPTECERLQGLPDGWTHVHGAPMVGATPLWETLSRLWWPDGSDGES